MCKYIFRFWCIYILTLTLRRINSDAIALNIGKDVWEPAQVAKAYAAAEAISNSNARRGSGPKLKPVKAFFSFDFTSLKCSLESLPNVISMVNQYANHPSQFKVNGKPMISSYEGGCLGNAGWESLKTQTNGYTMPFISGLEGNFSQWTALDSWHWLVWFDENFLFQI